VVADWDRKVLFDVKEFFLRGRRRLRSLMASGAAGDADVFFVTVVREVGDEPWEKHHMREALTRLPPASQIYARECVPYGDAGGRYLYAVVRCPGGLSPNFVDAAFQSSRDGDVRWQQWWRLRRYLRTVFAAAGIGSLDMLWSMAFLRRCSTLDEAEAELRKIVDRWENNCGRFATEVGCVGKRFTVL
jgi:hypothetical protein